MFFNVFVFREAGLNDYVYKQKKTTCFVNLKV